MEESSYWYSLSAVVEVRHWTPVTFSSDEKVLNIKVLHKAVSVLSSELENIYLQRFLVRPG